MLNHMNIDELNISFYVKPRPLRSMSSHALWPECSQPLCPLSCWPRLYSWPLLSDHISTNTVARWRLLLRSSVTRWRLVWPECSQPWCPLSCWPRLYSWPLLSDHISTNTVDMWRLLLRSSVTRWRLVYSYVPRRRSRPVVIVRSSLDEVRSICVVFVVKYISSCVCASTFEHLITRSYYRCNGSFGDMLHSTHGIGGTRNIVVYACQNTNRRCAKMG